MRYYMRELICATEVVLLLKLGENEVFLSLRTTNTKVNYFPYH
jgi:hypothetical protein